MGCVPAGPQNAHDFFQAAAPIFEVFEHAVRDYEVEGTVPKRERFREGERKPANITAGRMCGINRKDASEAVTQNVQLKSVATAQLQDR